MKKAKILIIDIETAPNIAYVWGAWKQNVGANQWLSKTHIMSFAAKWLGGDKIIYEDNRKSNDKKIVKSMFKLLDEADIVVAHNGQKFDVPLIMGRGVVHNLTPPSPFFIVDTLLVARQKLRLPSNSLQQLAEQFDLAIKKGGHKKFPGFELWLQCLKGNEEAWEEMRVYNVDDILVLEELYLRLLPYMTNHPNVVRETDGEEIACPKCGSKNIQWRGYYYSRAGICYRRFRCMDCGGWGRVRFAEKDRPSSATRNTI